MVLEPILDSTVAQPVKTRLESRISHFKGGWAWTCHQPYGTVTQRRAENADLSMPRLESNSELAQPCDTATWSGGSSDLWTRSSSAALQKLHLLISFYKLKLLWELAFICRPGYSPPRRFWTNLQNSTHDQTNPQINQYFITTMKCFILGLDGRCLIMPLNLGPDNPFEASNNSNWRALSN